MRIFKHGRAVAVAATVAVVVVGGLSAAFVASGSTPEHAKHDGAISRYVKENPEVVGDVVKLTFCGGSLVVMWYTLNPFPAIGTCGNVGLFYNTIQRGITLHECTQQYGVEVCTGMREYQPPISDPNLRVPNAPVGPLPGGDVQPSLDPSPYREQPSPPISGPNLQVPNAPVGPLPGGNVQSPSVRDGSIEGTQALTAKLTECAGLDDCQEPFTRDWRPTYDITNCNGRQCQIFDSAEWQAPVDLKFDGESWKGSGSLTSDIAFTCFGAPRPSFFSIALTATSANFVNGVWTATKLKGTIVESSAATAQCPEAQFSWNLSS